MQPHGAKAEDALAPSNPLSGRIPVAELCHAHSLPTQTAHDFSCCRLKEAVGQARKSNNNE